VKEVKIVNGNQYGPHYPDEETLKEDGWILDKVVPKQISHVEYDYIYYRDELDNRGEMKWIQKR